jgi:hypothetical protein
VFALWQIRFYAGTQLTVAAGFRAIPRINQPDFFIFLRLIRDSFLSNSFLFIADQST